MFGALILLVRRDHIEEAENNEATRDKLVSILFRHHQRNVGLLTDRANRRRSVRQQ
jgi:hypothetical protein